MKKQEALLLYGSSQQDANLFYATRLFIPDPFFLIQKDKKKILILSDLEIDRAKKHAAVDKVLSYSKYYRRVSEKTAHFPTEIDVLEEILLGKRIKKIIIPANFPYHIANQLQARGFKIEVQTKPLFPERRIKSSQEIKAITSTCRHTEKALSKAIFFLKQARIKGRFLWHQGKKVTPQDIKQIIRMSLLQSNCFAEQTIVAGGEEACDPHQTGQAPLQAHKSIVIDIFPKSLDSGYHADITRTVVRGKPSPALKQLYQTVHEAQKIGIKKLKPGVKACDVHQAICQFFEKSGYKTGVQQGYWQGFFHGTGHGLGLEVHEPPRISATQDILKPGDVITIEPGLYYRGIGGVRLEDDLLITKTGAKNLTRFPKVFEI